MANFLSIVAAVEAVTGKRPNPATCWRWTTRGVAGIRLESQMVGGRRMTTTDAVRKFLEERTLQTTPTMMSSAPLAGVGSKSKVNSAIAKTIEQLKRELNSN